MNTVLNYIIDPLQLMLASIGLATSCFSCVLLHKNRLTNERTTNTSAFFGLVQSLLDMFIQFFFIVSYIPYPKITNYYAGEIFCRFLKSFCLFWITITLRVGTNVGISLMNFIKLLYPFLTGTNILIVVIGGVTYLTVCVCVVTIHFMTIGYYMEFKHNKNCQFDENDRFEEVTGLVGIRKYSSIFIFVHLYLFPVTSTLVLYMQIYYCLKDFDDEPRKIALVEIKKSFLLDNVLYFICYSYYFYFAIFSPFTGFYQFGYFSLNHRIAIAFVLLYSVLYSIISITTRRVYRKPLYELVKFIDEYSVASNKSSEHRRRMSILGNDSVKLCCFTFKAPASQGGSRSSRYYSVYSPGTINKDISDWLDEDVFEDDDGDVSTGVKSK